MAAARGLWSVVGWLSSSLAPGVILRTRLVPVTTARSAPPTRIGHIHTLQLCYSTAAHHARKLSPDARRSAQPPATLDSRPVDTPAVDRCRLRSMFRRRVLHSDASTPPNSCENKPATRRDACEHEYASSISFVLARVLLAASTSVCSAYVTDAVQRCLLTVRGAPTCSLDDKFPGQSSRSADVHLRRPPTSSPAVSARVKLSQKVREISFCISRRRCP